mmetsp:Transcript_48564/g.62326  ORF Transcript_48564/g.62326 Transcript_48564/m.62326 type:complete len:112 (+) Transcript_48564:75-410(+)
MYVRPKCVCILAHSNLPDGVRFGALIGLMRPVTFPLVFLTEGFNLSLSGDNTTLAGSGGRISDLRRWLRRLLSGGVMACLISGDPMNGAKNMASASACASASASDMGGDTR